MTARPNELSLGISCLVFLFSYFFIFSLPPTELFYVYPPIGCVLHWVASGLVINAFDKVPYQDPFGPFSHQLSRLSMAIGVLFGMITLILTIAHLSPQGPQSRLFEAYFLYVPAIRLVTLAPHAFRIYRRFSDEESERKRGFRRLLVFWCATLLVILCCFLLFVGTQSGIDPSAYRGEMLASYYIAFASWVVLEASTLICLVIFPFSKVGNEQG